MLLPLSRQEIAFRPLDGLTEALIAELPLDRPAATGIALLEALAADERLRPGDLLLTDFEAALAGLGREFGGDLSVSWPHCAHCGERNEISFFWTTLIDSVAPRLPAGVTPTAGGGALDGMHFRLPTAADARRAEGPGDAAGRLLQACIDGEVADEASQRRIERALARLAPLLSRVIRVPCTACGALVRLLIHVPSFVAQTFAAEARKLFGEVHLLARGYGWREADILAIPRSRRRRYVALLRESA